MRGSTLRRHDHDLPRCRRRSRGARRRVGRRRRLRQPGSLVGAEPARLGLRRPRLRARRRVRGSRPPPTASTPGTSRTRATPTSCASSSPTTSSRRCRSRRRADGLASWPAGTRSRSTGSTRPATSGWSRPACSGPRCAAATRRASASSPRSACTATSTGTRTSRTLAVAKAIGGLRQGAIELTPMQEAVLDLAVEQALSPALTRVNSTFVQVMLEHGIPIEAIITELVLSGEVERTCGWCARAGYAAQFEHHSPTSQYGQLTRRDALRRTSTSAATMRRLVDDIDVGPLRRRVGRRARRRLPEARAAARAARGRAVREFETALRRQLGQGAIRPDDRLTHAEPAALRGRVSEIRGWIPADLARCALTFSPRSLPSVCPPRSARWGPHASGPGSGPRLRASAGVHHADPGQRRERAVVEVAAEAGGGEDDRLQRAAGVDPGPLRRRSRCRARRSGRPCASRVVVVGHELAGVGEQERMARVVLLAAPARRRALPSAAMSNAASTPLPLS